MPAARSSVHRATTRKASWAKTTIVAYVESYAARFELPVREGVWVKSVKRAESRRLRGRDVRRAHDGRAGRRGDRRLSSPAHSRATRPSLAVNQLHSSEYRNAAALPPGEVLVVGTGQSGCQIAEDLHLVGRKVHLAVGSAPRCARRHRGRDVVEWLEDMGHYDLPIDQQKNPDELRERANHYVTGRAGGHDLDLRRFALEGMKLYGPATGIDGRQAALRPQAAPAPGPRRRRLSQHQPQHRLVHRAA